MADKSLQKTGVRDFKDLIVWQKSIRLVKEVYKSTDALPPAEKFGLYSQMRRCAISIPSNIAEGKKRKSKKDFSRFLSMADGSAAELETQIIIAKELFNISFDESEALLKEVQKMLATILRKFSL